MKNKSIFSICIVSLTLFGCDKKEETPELPANFLTTTIKQNNVPADDNTFDKVLVHIDPSYLPVVPSITATTNLGTLQTTTLNFDANGDTYIYLKSKESGTANLTITAKSQNVLIDVNFVTSYPESLNINTVASLSNNLDQRLAISINLRKTLGNVSSGIPVNISATDSLGNTKGSFYNFTNSNADGLITGEYWLQDTTYLGFIYFKAEVFSSSDTIIGTNRVLIVN